MTIFNTDYINEKPADIAVFKNLYCELYDHGWLGKTHLDEIEFFVANTKGLRTLELGSGTGRMSIALLKRGIDLYGLEASKDMFCRLQSKLSVNDKNRFILWDARKASYPIDAQTFDCIIIPFSTFCVIHNNVENFEKNNILPELNRLLKPKGRLIINDYRAGRFERKIINSSTPVVTFNHQHDIHGAILEMRFNAFFSEPGMVLTEQVYRVRRTVLVRLSDGAILEEHHEKTPVLNATDFPILGSEAGFKYVSGNIVHYHSQPSMNHIFEKG